jgi:arginine decarboxylase
LTDPDRSTILMALDGGQLRSAVLSSKVDILADQFRDQGYDVVLVRTAADAVAYVSSQADLAAALVSWDWAGGAGDHPAEAVLSILLERFSARLPVFLLTTGDHTVDPPLWVSEVVNGWVWLLEDTPRFVAGRIAVAAQQYLDEILPPFFRELRRFDRSNEYSWHTPAHAGGIAFLKSPVGRAYYDYYGEQLFRSDLSVSVGELGSLFEHTGPIGDAERNAARVFGADTTYFVLHGTSTADRLIIQAVVPADDVVLLDRNCHKAINHGVVMAFARPRYLVPTRNGYGLTGPIPPARLAADVVPEPVGYTVITNSTYDGLCYDAVRVAELLGPSTARLHFDEAWFPYARFHPLYARRYGMAVDGEALPGEHRPTVFASQSTHKLLAALSQASMIHVKDSPRAPFDAARFGETFMMHATTSPLYPMIASLDVSAAMMDGPGGRWLTTEMITEAIRFRQAMVRLGRRIAESGDRPPWFFGAWQPSEVTTPSGWTVAFDEAPLDLLRTEPGCWTLQPDAAWHGFPDLEPGFCMLDPVKVSITCPGVDAAGQVDAFGIPARLVTAYLETRRIVVEKTDAYTFLVLFSMGITKGKWGTLLDALVDFKNRYDRDTALAEVLPDLVANHPQRYADLTLPQLCDQMHRHLVDGELVSLVNEAFTDPTPPEAALTPAQAYQSHIRGDTQLVPLSDIAGRVVATQVTTTPPGIPVLMPGERAGGADGPLLRYLRMLESFDQRFPGYASETHGIHRDAGGGYWIACVKE